MPHGRDGATNFAVRHAYRAPREAYRTGGDLALARRHDDGALTFALIDLWAKGAQADHYARRLRAAFSTAMPAHSPAALLAQLNERLCEELRVCRELEGSAAACVVRCTADGRVCYASAGADDGLVFHAGEVACRLPATGPLLGLDDGARFGQGDCAPLHSGDVLLVCTDGVTEARSPSSGRLLGVEGLVAVMRGLLETNALRPEILLDRIAAWSGGAVQDDATALFAVPRVDAKLHVARL